MGYTINKKEYKSKSKVKDYFQKILKTNKVGNKLPKAKFEDVLALLKYHTDAENKIGCGVKYITTKHPEGMLTEFMQRDVHFNIIRVDGTEEDFSYNNCINNLGKGFSEESRFKEYKMKALRLVIKPQIDYFRNKMFGNKTYLKCPLLHLNFSKKTCHIDHEPPNTFVDILISFLKKENIKLSDIKIYKVNNYIYLLEDKILSEKWYGFHKNNAKLRAIHKTANMAQSCKRFPKEFL